MMDFSGCAIFRLSSTALVTSFLARRITLFPSRDHLSFAFSIDSLSMSDNAATESSLLRTVRQHGNRISDAPFIESSLNIVSTGIQSQASLMTHISVCFSAFSVHADGTGVIIRIMYLFLLLKAISKAFFHFIFSSLVGSRDSENRRIA